jgi:hypothetical protein
VDFGNSFGVFEKVIVESFGGDLSILFVPLDDTIVKELMIGVFVKTVFDLP